MVSDLRKYLFFFNDTATTKIYTLSLHDALPISVTVERVYALGVIAGVDHAAGGRADGVVVRPDRKSTRLNSSHANISYAVFCLKKKHVFHHPPLSVLSSHHFSSSRFLICFYSPS